MTGVALPTSFEGEDFGGRLFDARAGEVGEIRRAMTSDRAVVVTGEHGAGKTGLVRRATAPLALSEDWYVAELNLRRGTSDTRLAWEWFRALAGAIAGPVAFSHIAAMAPSTWPGRTRAAALDIRRVLGRHTDWALAERPDQLTPDAAQEAVRAARDATLACAAERPTVLVIDHVEAPSDAPRKPIDVGQLLWSLRPGARDRERLHVAVVCHPTLLPQVGGVDAPFLGAPIITVRWPAVELWREALAGIQITDTILKDVLARTGGHIPSTVLVLWTLRSSPNATVGAAFDALARTQHQHAERCLRHAATLHRLGAQLLEVVGRGERPYQATPDARSTRDVSVALNALWRAGLVVHPEDGRWEIADPFVAHLLRTDM